MIETASESDAARKALNRWFSTVKLLRVAPWISHGGLSGARIWKVEDGQNSYCLRQWPAGQTAPRLLTTIHELMGHLQRVHPRLVPRPLPSREGSTAANVDGRWWEVTSWMPGAACHDDRVRPEQIRAALQALGQLHRSAEDFDRGDSIDLRASPGLVRRWEFAHRLLGGGLAVLDNAVNEAPATSIVLAARRALNRLPPALAKIADELETAARLQLKLQWRLGDVHREHVLFVGNQVSGVVDYGAATVDSPVGDVARLLGSLAGDHAEDWHAGLSAYQQIRPLTDLERQALVAFDAGGLCAAVANWARWLAIERREVPSPTAVESRLHRFAVRLEALNSRGRASVFDWERH